MHGQRTNGHMVKRTNVQMDEKRRGLVESNGQMKRRTNVHLDKWTIEQMDNWTIGLMDSWNESTLKNECTNK